MLARKAYSVSSTMSLETPLAAVGSPFVDLLRTGTSGKPHAKSQPVMSSCEWYTMLEGLEGSLLGQLRSAVDSRQLGMLH